MINKLQSGCGRANDGGKRICRLKFANFARGG